jgi:hypothetical protein
MRTFPSSWSNHPSGSVCVTSTSGKLCFSLSFMDECLRNNDVVFYRKAAKVAKKY